MRMYKDACAVMMLLCLVGCTTWVKEETSHPVTSWFDNGEVPHGLPRHIQGFPKGEFDGLMDFRKFGVDARAEMSNIIKTANGKTESKENEPLVVKVAMNAEFPGSKVLIKDIVGDLFLSSNKVLRPIEIYVQAGSFCIPLAKSGRVDLRNKEILLVYGSAEERVYRALDNFKVEGGRISALDACVIFKYAEPVSVKSVFKIDFAKVVLADGEIKPLSATFYPIVRDYMEK